MAAHKMGLKLILSSLCLVTVVLSNLSADPRTLTTVLNPDCNQTDCSPGLAYIKAKSTTMPGDTLHYLISAMGVPTILVLHTVGGSEELTLDWDKLASKNVTEREGSISFSGHGTVKSSFAVIFSRLYEYNDTDDAADLTHYYSKNTSWNIHNFMEFDWTDIREYSMEKDNMVVLNVSQDSELFANGTLSYKFQAFSSDSRASDLPHLEHNENITMFDFTIDHMNTNMSRARYALEMSVLSDHTSGGPMKLDKTKSIDDEYTPGVFTIVNWLTQPKMPDFSGYMQWKPVVYQNTPKSRSVMTSLEHYDLNETDAELTEILKHSIVYAYFGDKFDQLAKMSTNISFGLSQDGWYTKTNYSTWTASVGYGNPPFDKVSFLVIGVISAGLGIPIVLILFGGIFVCVKKQQKKYQQVPSNVTSSYPTVN